MNSSLSLSLFYRFQKTNLPATTLTPCPFLGTGSPKLISPPSTQAPANNVSPMSSTIQCTTHPQGGGGGGRLSTNVAVPPRPVLNQAIFPGLLERRRAASSFWRAFEKKKKKLDSDLLWRCIQGGIEFFFFFLGRVS